MRLLARKLYPFAPVVRLAIFVVIVVVSVAIVIISSCIDVCDDLAIKRNGSMKKIARRTTGAKGYNFLESNLI